MNIEIIKNSNTIYLGKKIQFFKEIDSTHLYAKKNYDKIEHGEIIIADNQTAGIGTKGRNWYSNNKNNIQVSIVLFPKCTVNKLENLTLMIAKAIVSAINELYNYKLTIKEPNDILLNNKKISGILTEIHTIGDKIKFLIISIGFNVNQVEFVEEIKDIATSLKKEFNKVFNREEIIKKIIENLEKVIEQL